LTNKTPPHRADHRREHRAEHRADHRSLRSAAPGFSLKEFFDDVAGGLSDAKELLSLGQLLAANRERLGVALAQGSIAEARAIVKQMCTDHPAIAGVVNYVMTSDVDSAINTIGLYDAELSESLRGCRTNFAELQRGWSAPSVVRS